MDQSDNKYLIGIVAWTTIVVSFAILDFYIQKSYNVSIIVTAAVETVFISGILKKVYKILKITN